MTKDQLTPQQFDTLVSFFCDNYSLTSLHENIAYQVAQGRSRVEIEEVLAKDPLVRIAVKLEMATEHWFDCVFSDLLPRQAELRKHYAL